jgi:hypothetical protein
MFLSSFSVQENEFIPIENGDYTGRGKMSSSQNVTISVRLFHSILREEIDGNCSFARIRKII